MPRHTLTIFCLLLASTAPMLPEGVRASSRARAVADVQDEVVRYAVKPGDTLPKLAAAHFVDPQGWQQAQTFNALSADATLVPGSILKLRQSWLKASPIRAEIVAWRGEVAAVSGAVRTPVSVGLKLGEGDRLETGANGFVTIRLPDASLVTLPSNSRIRMERLRAVSLTQSIDRRFVLEAGRSESMVTPMTNAASKFMITTPVSVAAVRGTKFRVSYTPSEMKAREEVLEGKVEVGPRGEPSGKAGEVLLLPGFGAVAGPQGVSRAIALLPAPALEAPARVQTGEAVRFQLQTVPGAKSYVVELATDADFVDRFVELETSGTDIRFAAVPNGSLHVRIAARDANGLTGLPASYAFERRFAGAAVSTPENGQRPAPAAKDPSGEARPGRETPGGDESAEERRPTLLSQLARRAENAVDAAATVEAAGDEIVEEGDAGWDDASYEPMRLFGDGGSGGGYIENGGAPPVFGGGGWQSPGSGTGPVVPEPDSPAPVGPDLPPLVLPPVVLPPVVLPPSVFPPGVLPPQIVLPAPLPPVVDGESIGQIVLPILPAPPAGPMQPVAPIPEPAAWAYLIGGFGAVGLALRRRRLLKASPPA